MRAGLPFFAMTWSALALAAPGDSDVTYGQAGRTVISAQHAGGVRLQPNRFIQQADGKTVIVGWTEVATVPEDFAVVRLNTDGSLDTTFDEDGDGIVIIGFGSLDQGIGIVEQSDHKLVVVGLSNGGTCTQNPCIAIARLNENGRLDSTFGAGTGKVVLSNPIAARGSIGIDVVTQSSGDLVIGGHKPTGDFVFLRVNSAGIQDPTFNAGIDAGVAVVDMGHPTSMFRMIAQADGNLLAVGGAAPNAQVHQMGMVRLTSNGLLDPSFNNGNRLITPCAAFCQYLRVVQQPDQKLVLVGLESADGEGSPPLHQARSLLERRHLDGSLDSSFASGGRRTNVFATLEPHPVATAEAASGVAVDPATGNITVVGRMTVQSYSSTGTVANTNVRLPVARFTANGSVDTTFGVGGLRMLPTAVGPSGDPHAVVWYNVNLLPDGRAMVLGASGQSVNGVVSDEGMAVARLLNGDPGNAGVLSVSGFPALESAPFAWAVVARSAGSTGAISVTYSTVPVTATAGADFVATSGTLSWADGDLRSKLIKVPLIRDSIAESTDEIFQIALSNPSVGVDIASAGTVTIFRDDAVPVNAITVSAAPATVSESSGAISFTVTRTGTAPISVNYTTAWDSATGAAQSPSDYAHVNGILIWGAGDTAPKTISIPIANDTLVESAEELNLAFFLFGGGAVHTNSLTTVVIADDDAPPTPPNPPTPPSPPAGGGGNGGGGGGGGSLSLVWLALLSGVAMARSRRRLLSRSAG